jgi:hypothetical protein
MADTYINPNALDSQLNYITAKTDIWLYLVPTWLRSQSYATANTNKIAEYDVSGDGAVFSAIVDDTGGNGDSDAPNRRLPVGAVTYIDAVAGNVATTDLCQMLVDKTGTEILAVTNETTNRAVTVGDSITSFAFFVQASQPTQVA